MNVHSYRGALLDANLSSQWPRSVVAHQPSQPHYPMHGVLAQQNLAQAMQCLVQALTQINLTSSDPPTALLNIVSYLGEIFQVDSCIVALQDSYQATTQAVCWCPGMSPKLAEYPAVAASAGILDHPLIQRQLASSSLVIIPDLQSAELLAELDPLAGLESPEGPEPKTHEPSTLLGFSAQGLFAVGSVLLIQTRFQGQINGVIALMRSQPYAWSTTEIDLLQAASTQVAIAISQANLHWQLQQQVRHQALIERMTRAIRDSWDLDQIFQLAAEETVSALRISRSLVLQLKYTEPWIKSRLGEGAPKAKATVVCEWPRTAPTPDLAAGSMDLAQPESGLGSWLNTSFWVSDCRLCQHAFQGEAEPITIPAIANPHSSALNSTVAVEALDVAPMLRLDLMPALMLIPLENQGTVLGYLALQHCRLRAWHPGELAFARLVASQLSTAIIQTQTLRQIQALVEERTAQLQRSLDVQAKLYEKTRQQVHQLRQLNQLKDEFLSTMSHELRTPLTSMTLAIRMLRQAPLSPERQEKYLDILEQQCSQETNLINDLLALQKIESGASSPQLQKIDLKYLLQSLKQSFESSWSHKQLTLVTDLPDQPLMLHTDPNSLNRILMELFNNAGKYSDPETTVRLQIRPEMRQQIHCWVMTLHNLGAGIAAEELPYIFDKFRRGQGVTQQAIQGTGLGLALVKGLAEHLNGTITATSQPIVAGEQWETQFVLTLPQSPLADLVL